MGEHYPSDGGSLGGDGGSPKVYPYEVNPIEVTPLSPLTPQGEQSECESKTQIPEPEDKAKTKNSKAEKKPETKKVVRKTKPTCPSLNDDETIKTLLSWQLSCQANDYHQGFLDYLVSSYLPKVGRWRDMGELPTLGDAKNWIALREKDGNYTQIQNKWDDYHTKIQKQPPRPYTPPVTPLTIPIPITPEGIEAKAKAREYLEAFKALLDAN
ncbi:hypothetical protein C7B64_13500 [Merismopedia glauca CCAP 1448/3]|uniref:Uncharacterized protein n=2 Tax=Merismopedia TaxID=53402 RepID=A0A2T1C288_9CYAN|nr:hypothetical protein C7B64_13500 [Merismopedia glauca CCAP 1448/3]